MKEHLILYLVPVLALIFSAIGHAISYEMWKKEMPSVSEGELDSSYRLLTKFSVCWYVFLAALCCAGWL